VKLIPKDFQAEAVQKLLKMVRTAAKESRGTELQSVSLASLTGSGKTVMVTNLIELLLVGDDDNPPMPDATFLWVTDQPELNEQTRRKMRDASTELTEPNLVVVDAAFDQETFRPGVVYFLNIQKLGREKGLVTTGDRRTFTIWETIRNTITSRPARFFVIIDEAHRGMSENPRARNEATTIIQKFIKGSPGEIPPVPVVIGISATPERYNELIENTERTRRQVNVKPEDVRESGLLKEVVTLYHPKDDQETDVTMLRAAARASKKFGDHWARYAAAQAIPSVAPILVVQVQDGPGKQISKTDIAQAIQAINDEVGPLPNEAFAHSFQEGAAITVGSQEVRYLAPPNIADDPDVRVVFFKTSLNTGWDCPRAEVMMSFRTARDATLIAQLVGRMVRTPLARRVDTDEFLNTVALYLPHYDDRELEAVIKRLSKSDEDVPPLTVEKGEDVVTLNRAAQTDAFFAALEKLPSYVIPRSRKSSEIKRLMKLSRLLAHDEIIDDAPEKATEVLLKILRAHYQQQKRTQRFKTIVEDKGTIEVHAVNVQVGTDLTDDAGVIRLDIASENVDDLFDAAGRKLGEGLHKAWWRERVNDDPSAKDTAKLELFALCTDTDVLKKLGAKAQDTVQTWLRSHASKINGLPEVQQQQYNDVRRLAAEPEEIHVKYLDSIQGKKASTSWQHHLYVDEKGRYPAKFNTWETAVLEEELENKQLVGWLRNPDRKEWSLCVPYIVNAEARAFFPDFLFLRKVGKDFIVDILDPHLPTLEDAAPKAVGLATYADKHAHLFGRIELIIVEGDAIKRLDLTNERVRNLVKAVTTNAHLRQLFTAT